jgi:hypothetical protein
LGRYCLIPQYRWTGALQEFAPICRITTHRRGSRGAYGGSIASQDWHRTQWVEPGRQAPDFKTIADFRKNNGAAIRAVSTQFVVLCRKLGLFTRAVVAIDGSKFKAVNNRDKNYRPKVTGRIEQADANIARYLRALDRADREEGDVAEAKSVRRKEKQIGPVEGEDCRPALVAARLEGDGADQKVSLTDSDARSMATSGKGTSTVDDNVQIADRYRHLSACFPCPLKPRCDVARAAGLDPAPAQVLAGRPVYCTAEKVTPVKRWKHEGVLDTMRARLDRMPETVGVRRLTVEHLFGTLKAWMGVTHFLARTLDKVRTETSLHVLAYNLKRVVAIFGVGPLIAAIRTLIPAIKPHAPVCLPLSRPHACDYSASAASANAFFRGWAAECVDLAFKSRLRPRL